MEGEGEGGGGGGGGRRQQRHASQGRRGTIGLVAASERPREPSPLRFFCGLEGASVSFFFWDSRGRELLIFGVGVAEVDQ